MCVPRREWSRTKLNKKKLPMSTTCSVCVAFDKTLVFASVWLGDPSKLSSRSSPSHLPASLQLIQSPPELSQSFLNLIWLDTQTPVFWKAALSWMETPVEFALCLNCCPSWFELAAAELAANDLPPLWLRADLCLILPTDMKASLIFFACVTVSPWLAKLKCFHDHPWSDEDTSYISPHPLS